MPQQAVILSLTQQLSVDLHRDTALKLRWLSEAVSNLDPSSPVLANHLLLVLQDVQRAVQDAAGLCTSPELQTLHKMASHMIQSMLTAAQRLPK